MKAFPSLKPDDVLDMSWQNLNAYFVEVGAMNEETAERIESRKGKNSTAKIGEKSMTLNDLRQFPGAKEAK